MSSTAGKKFSWAGNQATTQYTLTNSYVVSDPIDCRYASMAKICARYTPGANNSTLTFYVETNPFDQTEDAADAYWSPQGFYVDGSGNQQTNTTGSWKTQTAIYNSLATTASGTVEQLVPVPANVLEARQIRVWAKETTAGGAGTVTFTLAKNDY